MKIDKNGDVTYDGFVDRYRNQPRKPKKTKVVYAIDWFNKPFPEKKRKPKTEVNLTKTQLTISTIILVTIALIFYCYLIIKIF